MSSISKRMVIVRACSSRAVIGYHFSCLPHSFPAQLPPSCLVANCCRDPAVPDYPQKITFGEMCASGAMC
jgi:hypothetical protein